MLWSSWKKVSVKKYFLALNTISLFLGKPAIVSATEIDQMKDYLNGVYDDIRGPRSVGESHTISEGLFQGSAEK